MPLSLSTDDRHHQSYRDAGDNLTTVGVTVESSSLPTGAATEATLLDIKSNLDLITPKPVLQFLDTNPVLDTSSTNIPASGGSILTVIATTGQASTKVRVADTTGRFIHVYENSTLKFIINPGMDATIDCSFSSGVSVGLRHNLNTSISKGSVLLELR